MADIFYAERIFLTRLDLSLHIFEQYHCFFWIRQKSDFPRPDFINDVRNKSSTPSNMRREKTFLAMFYLST